MENTKSDAVYGLVHPVLQILSAIATCERGAQSLFYLAGHETHPLFAVGYCYGTGQCPRLRFGGQIHLYTVPHTKIPLQIDDCGQELNFRWIDMENFFAGTGFPAKL